MLLSDNFVDDSEFATASPLAALGRAVNKAFGKLRRAPRARARETSRAPWEVDSQHASVEISGRSALETMQRMTDLLDPARVTPTQLAVLSFLAGVGLTLLGVVIAL